MVDRTAADAEDDEIEIVADAKGLLLGVSDFPVALERAFFRFEPGTVLELGEVRPRWPRRKSEDVDSRAILDTAVHASLHIDLDGGDIREPAISRRRKREVPNAMEKLELHSAPFQHFR